MSTQQNNSLNIRLPATPSNVEDPKVFLELMQIYNAIRNLQYGMDQFLDIPPDSQTVPYTWNITDRGKSIDCGPGCTSVTIPLDATPAQFNPGATTVITNLTGINMTVVPTAGVTLVLGGTTTTGTRTLANFGICTIRYVANNVWLITGAGVS